MSARNGLLAAAYVLMCMQVGETCNCKPSVSFTFSNNLDKGKTFYGEPLKDKARIEYSYPEARASCGSLGRVKKTAGPDQRELKENGSYRIHFEVLDDSCTLHTTSVMVHSKVYRCTPRPGPVANGWRDQCNPYFTLGCVWGATVRSRCLEGYQLTGPTATVECVRGSGEAYWNYAFPICTGVSCGDPNISSMPHRRWVCSGTRFRDTCWAVCDPGYKLSHTIPITCGANGRWSDAVAKCIDSEPPGFDSGCPPDMDVFSGPTATPVVVDWPDPEVSDNSGNVTLTYRPPRGSSLAVGTHPVTAFATDADGNRDTCTFMVTVKPRTCVTLETPAHSTMHCSHTNLEGSQCTFQCHEGFQLNGQTAVACLETGFWNGTSPSCTGLSCGQPPAVKYGSITCGNGTQFQAICTLTCHEGFVAEGQATVVCTGSGEWSQIGSCRDVTRPYFPNGCPPNIQQSAARLGEPTPVSWTDPIVGDNSGSNVTLACDAISGQEFPLGVTAVTYTATDSSGNRAICNFTVTVTTLNCGQPDLEGGKGDASKMLYNCRNGTVYGATCGVSCMQGYPMTGDKSITCERDDSTFPPTMVWWWTGAPDLAMKPKCADVVCPNLTAPANGALACFQGNHGRDCYMFCNEGYDVPNKVPDGGRYTCPNSLQTWIPKTMVNCTVRLRPGTSKVHADIFYYAGDCETAIEDIKKAFIDRLTNSTFADACVNVPACVPENVEVTCGTISGNRRRRRSRDFYVRIEFDIVMEYSEDEPDALQTHIKMKDDILKRLNEEVEQGKFDINGLETDEYGFAGILDCNCPAGSACSTNYETNRFTCKKCTTGYYMPEGHIECYACPVGSYQDQDIATNCTSCPEDMSTISTGSESLHDCQEMCPPGFVSGNGFVPCYPCAPGTYQASQGQRSCEQCPLGTSTPTDRATSREQCVAGDFHLITTRSSLDFSLTDKTTLAAWFYIPYLSSILNITVLSEGAGVFENIQLLLQRDNSTVQYGSFEDPISLRDLIRPGAWFHLAITNDNSRSSSNIYLNGELLPGFPLNMTKVDNIAGEVLDEVLLSGLLSVDRVLAPEEVKTAATTCAVDVDSNRLIINVTVMATTTMPALCDAIDECASSPCGHHTCENQLGSYTCDCQNGWTGDQCQTPPDHCKNVQCMNGATCVTSETNYTCICSDGYTGTLCQVEIVTGGWSDWSFWSDCSETCGGGQQHRHRLCNNPPPQAGGQDCVGESNQTQNCGAAHCAVNGGWGEWEEWSACSASCRGGGRTRARKCDNPPPMHDGEDCLGESEQEEYCNTQVCPGDGNWGLWSEWSQCSASCAGGVQFRSRQCDDPPPSNGGNPCDGDANNTRTCNDHTCPECPRFERPPNAYPPRITTVGENKECQIICLEGYGMAVDYPTKYYCGPATSFAWSSQPDVNASYEEPSCTKQHPVEGGRIGTSVVMEIDCDNDNDTPTEEVRRQIHEQIVQTLPCSSTPDALCKVETTATCGGNASSRRRRSTHGTDGRRVQISTVVSGDIGNNTDLTPNTTSHDEYLKLIKMAEDTVSLITNGTESLFTVTVGGKTIKPDMSTVDFSGGYSCPGGSGEMNGFCADCPPGSSSDGSTCRLCPMGQYQDETAATECKPCPPGFTWVTLGAVSIDQCVYSLEEPPPPKPETGSSAKPVPIVAIAVGVSVTVVAVIAVAAVSIWYKSKWVKWNPVSNLLPLRRISRKTPQKTLT